MSFRLAAIAVVSCLAAACSTYETRTVVVPAPATTAAEDSCAYYGYTPGTEAYRMCADREVQYRRMGRMSRADYTQARVVVDSQEACASYGLSRGSERYDRCVQREVAYRTPS